MRSNTLLSFIASALLASPAFAQLSCNSFAAGESCGPQLTVTFTPGGGGNYTIDMVGTGMHPNSFGGFTWGLNPVAVDLPGGCRILSDYVWGHYFQTDAAGSASWGRSWPHWATIQFYMQMASLEIHSDGSFDVLTTNCKYAGCL